MVRMNDEFCGDLNSSRNWHGDMLVWYAWPLWLDPSVSSPPRSIPSAVKRPDHRPLVCGWPDIPSTVEWSAVKGRSARQSESLYIGYRRWWELDDVRDCSMLVVSRAVSETTWRRRENRYEINKPIFYDLRIGAEVHIPRGCVCDGPQLLPVCHWLYSEATTEAAVLDS